MTVQVAETIIYKGEKSTMQTEPLREYLKENNIKFLSSTSACWRGYRGTWEVSDNKLFLVELRNCIFNKQIDLKDMFKQKQDKVFANWFTDSIYIPHGKIIKNGLFGIDDRYEKDIVLKFEKGVLISEEIIENKRSNN